MKTKLALFPVLAVAAASLSACQQEPTKAPAPSAAQSSSSQPSSTQSQTSTPSSSSSSSSSNSSSSASSSSSSSSSAKVSAAELSKLADSETIRACLSTDVSYIMGGAEYCNTDSSSIDAHRFQTIYVTLATKVDPKAKYSFHATNGTASQDGDISGNASLPKDAPMSLYLKLPVSGSGHYTVTFKQDGKDMKSKSFDVKVS